MLIVSFHGAFYSLFSPPFSSPASELPCAGGAGPVPCVPPTSQKKNEVAPSPPCHPPIREGQSFDKYIC
ncbi:hypothetical protein DV515_00005617 [Chloebia gouldiae]|uniref:Uncharacterized protein n=1 Tax=Chloebia gouldiae TaxID=44316 RepID=A0A3L8SP53_CHLGU|nr:hypothetical protein DV515_00005617 [Chloebia gouldiae]